MKTFPNVFDQVEPILIVIDGLDEVRPELREDFIRLVRDGLRPGAFGNRRKAVLAISDTTAHDFE